MMLILVAVLNLIGKYIANFSCRVTELSEERLGQNFISVIQEQLKSTFRYHYKY